jgi:hypothetical protein
MSNPEPSVRDARSVLGVTPTATPAQVGAAFRRRAKAVHPDVSAALDAASEFAALTAAYRVALQATACPTNGGADVATQKPDVLPVDRLAPRDPALIAGLGLVAGSGGTVVWDAGRPVMVAGPVTVCRPPGGERVQHGRRRHE